MWDNSFLETVWPDPMLCACDLDTLYVATFASDCGLLGWVLQTLNLLLGPSSASRLMPVTGKGGCLRGNRKGRGVECQLTLLHPCPASWVLSQVHSRSLHPTSRSAPFPSWAIQVSVTHGGMFPYVEFSQQTLIKLTNWLLRLGP